MKSAFIQLTPRCSLKCKYCFYNSSSLAMPGSGVIDLQELRKFLLFVGINNVMVTGGDPLNSNDFGRTIDLIKMLKKENIKTSINTSLAINDCQTSMIIASRPDMISISCDSHQKEVHDAQRGGWGLMQSALLRIVEANLPVTINCTLTRLNHNQIKEIWNFFANFRIYNINFNIAYLPQNSKQYKRFSCENLSLAEKRNLIEDLLWCAAKKSNPEKEFSYVAHQAKLFFGFKHEFSLKKRCQMGKKYLIITPNGDIKPCFHRSDVWGHIRAPYEILVKSYSLGDEWLNCVSKSCSSLFVIDSFWR